jgi:hypothetical protein
MNISKKRKFSGQDDNCPYHIYNLNKKQMGDYMNMWFLDGQYYKGKPLNKDQYWTVKKVDKETAGRLYLRILNPVSIHIMPSYDAMKKDKNTKLCVMKAQIHSIDDSSFGVWWHEGTTDILTPIRLKLMEWIDCMTILNGDEFIKICLSLGANEDTIDYN